eukprot:2061737-Rhodomonas_salina.2
MQAHAEGAVLICKDHVCCLLKSSNAPARFWPFALLHFCCTYYYWPGAHSPPPWESMDNSQFDFNMEQDLHPWGCYVVAKLPKEHPLVSVNTTHADRGIEGAFLGWHDSTPTCWIYSFRLQRILCMQDVVFNHDDEYPFMDPSCLVTPGILLDDQVVEMHKTDLKFGEWMDEEELSQLPTQPANTMESEIEQDDRQRTDPVTEPLREIAKTLWDPTLLRDNSDITRDTPEQRQLRKRVRDTEFETGIPISNDIPRDTKATKKHYK